jgi:hypothetical protein
MIDLMLLTGKIDTRETDRVPNVQQAYKIHSVIEITSSHIIIRPFIILNAIIPKFILITIIPAMLSREFLVLAVSPTKVRRRNQHEQTTSKRRRRTKFRRSPRYLVNISVRDERERKRGGERERLGTSAGDKVALCSRGKNGSGEPRALLIDGPRDFYLAHRSGQKPAERTFSRIFFAFIFFFLVYAFLTPPPPPGPSASAFASTSASSSPPSSFSSSSSSSSPSPPPLPSRSLDEGEIFRRPREAHVKERKKTWGARREEGKEEEEEVEEAAEEAARGAARRPKPH